jgi:hypothetical protein
LGFNSIFLFDRYSDRAFFYSISIFFFCLLLTSINSDVNRSTAQKEEPFFTGKVGYKSKMRAFFAAEAVGRGTALKTLCGIEK